MPNITCKKHLITCNFLSITYNAERFTRYVGSITGNKYLFTRNGGTITHNNIFFTRYYAFMIVYNGFRSFESWEKGVLGGKRRNEGVFL